MKTFEKQLGHINAKATNKLKAKARGGETTAAAAPFIFIFNWPKAVLWQMTANDLCMLLVASLTMLARVALNLYLKYVFFAVYIMLSRTKISSHNTILVAQSARLFGTRTMFAAP